jgi:peptide/nickel transport system substrate-binding protein
MTLRMAIIVTTALSTAPLHMQPTTALARSRVLGPLNIIVEGRFLDIWESQRPERDSVYLNGYPITARRPEISTDDGKTYDMQWFERARYEAHPENKAPYDVLLGRLGTSLTEGRGEIDPVTKQLYDPEDVPFLGINKPADANGTTKVWFETSRHSVSGKILEYWKRYGGIQQFGNPLSEQFQETSPIDNKVYTVQYFERNRFELRPDKPPPYEVELGLLGVQQYKLTPIPADQLPFAPPTRGNRSGNSSYRVFAGDTLVQASLQEPRSLVGIEEDTAVAARFTSAITFGDTMVTLDNLQNPVPTLVYYLPTISNGGTYSLGTGANKRWVTKFKLRIGVNWSDTGMMTSEDAVFAHAHMLANPNVVNNSLHKKIDHVFPVGNFTVLYRWMSLNQAVTKWNTLTPSQQQEDYAFLQTFITPPGKPVIDHNYLFVGTVLPKHVLSALPVNSLQTSAYAVAPVGLGPFRVQSWTRGSELVLEQNPRYNLTTQPLLKRIVSRFQTDVSQVVSQLVAGNLDAIAGEGLVVPPAACSSSIVASNGTCAVVPSTTWEHLEPYFGYAPFQDKKVRQAIMHAINREQIARVVFKGTAKVMNGPAPPVVYYSLENPNYATTYPPRYRLPRYNYDVAAANALLDSAGWVKGADGVRAKNGVKLSFQYGTNRSETRQAIQALVQADLRAVGIDALTVVYNQDFFDPKGPIATGKAQLAQFAYSSSNYTTFDAYSIDELWSPQHIGKQNRQQYRNQRVTELNRAMNAETDTNRFGDYAIQIQVEMMNDVAVFPLVQRPNIEIYRNTLMNRRVTNSQVSQWWNIAQWYFR